MLTYRFFIHTLLIIFTNAFENENPLDYLPAVVSIRINFVNQLCSGVLLNDSLTILTTGHTMHPYEGLTGQQLMAKRIMVVMSDRNMSTSRLNYISSVVVHKSARRNSGISASSDIAVVRLKYKFVDKKGHKTKRTILPKPLGKDDELLWPGTSSQCYFVGWTMQPLKSFDFNCLQPELPIAFKMRILPKEDCLKNFPNTTSNQFCTLLDIKSRISLTKADVGSPVVCSQTVGGTSGNRNWFLAGLLSFGQFLLPCGQPEVPSYFLRIQSVLPWIQTYI